MLLIDIFKKYVMNESNENLFNSTEDFMDDYIIDAQNIDYEIVKSELDYYKEPKDFIIDGVELDKTYEAKCLPYIEPNDCLWIVGKRL